MKKPESIAELEKRYRISLKEVKYNPAKADYPEKSYATAQTGVIAALNLTGCDITSVNHLEAFRDLRYLCLWNNKLTDFDGISAMSELETLYIWGNSTSHMQGLSNLSKLKRLRIGDREVKKIEELDTLVNLEELSINSAKYHKNRRPCNPHKA